MRRVRADGVGAAPRRDDAASRAGDDYLQDYWGPVRFAFNETFKGEYTRSFKMVDPTLTANCAADFDALKQSGALADGGKYVADLRTMTQKNQQTSYSRRILREASP